MKILVSGATGFLGYNLCLRLKNEGYDVYGIGRNIQKGKQLENKGIHFLQIDLCDKEHIIKACCNKTYVFHCAAKSSAWGKYADFFKSNVIGTQNIVEGCLQNNVKRLIHVSSPSIYFEFKDKFNISENEALPKHFVNYYAKTKKMAEDIIFNAHLKKGLDTIVIRPRAIFGVGDTALLPRLIRSNCEKFIPIISKKDIQIDITHVDNVVEALILAMKAPNSCSGQKYNITNDSPIYMYEFLGNLMKKLKIPFKTKKIPYFFIMGIAFLLEFISKYFNRYKEPVFTRYTIGLLAYSQTLDISKAKKELGYNPIKTIEEGIKELVEFNEKTHKYC